MQAADYGKIAKWLINNGYGNTVLVPVFNKVFSSGKDSMFAVKSLGNMSPVQNLYSSLKDMGKFKDEAITENEFNTSLFDAFINAGGDTYHLAQMGGYRKKRKNKGKTYKKSSKKGKKTRKH
jgi:hypothetical protein